ncbi:restriction endonuclease subunit S [Nitrosomonas supralitoralis]|uniref:Type I restriction modification DNA specificity domain-containing protein n=1 Tax=Nitrosomonas supralitoralis TaxID=2116706 RepID=A0A2P7NSA1_9PROT|nr:restriction endonuclease subunit S [Nitrosomonas supralitoralis]PSJ16308.1 hypothetical protein C7H79_14235 [Nitrosomonas supralitoralis]
MKESFYRNSKELVTFNTGKLDSNAAEDDGKYPFFTCAQDTYRINKYAFNTECVLLAGNNAGGIFPLKFYKGKFNAYQRTYIIESRDPQRLDIKYFYFFLRPLLKAFEQQATGATTKFLTLKILNNIQVVLPSIGSQKKIAAILSAYDDLIENNQRRIALLEKMAEEIYREWFVRLRFPGHEKVRIIKGVPEGWEVRWVADLVDRKRFGRIYRESELLPEGAVIVIDQSTKEWLGFHEGKAEHQASPDRPLILFGDHSCKMQLMIEPFSLAENVIPFTSKNEMPIIFLYYLVHSLVETIEYKRHWTDLITKQVFVPASSLQVQFDERVRNLIIMAKHLKLVNANLGKTRDRLLPRLISGKLSIEHLDFRFPPGMEKSACV